MGPHFRPKEPQAHLNEAMIQMHENHIIAGFRQIVVEDNWPNHLRVRVSQAFCAGRPASPKGGKPENGAARAPAGRIGPDTINLHLFERRLPGKRKPDLHDHLNILRRETQLSLGVLKLIAEPLDLLAQVALELEHLAGRFRFLFSTGGIELLAVPQHRLLDLIGDDSAYLAEIFSDGVHLDRRAHQEL